MATWFTFGDMEPTTSPATRAQALSIPNSEPLLNGRCVGHVEWDPQAGTVLVMDWHDPAGCEHELPR